MNTNLSPPQAITPSAGMTFRKVRWPRIMAVPRQLIPCLLGATLGGCVTWAVLSYSKESGQASSTIPTLAAKPAALFSTTEADQGTLRLTKDQQAAVGLSVTPAGIGPVTHTLRAPGRIQPDESCYAIITPRASGVVQSVALRVGQEVVADQLLATIESPEVGQARLDLITKRQLLAVAKTQTAWQQTIYDNTRELVATLEAGKAPSEIHHLFKNRPLGTNRERLISAYADYRLEQANVERNRRLGRDNAIAPSKLQESEAQFESAQATYQALMDQMEVETRLDHVRAQQALREAETATRVAVEHLRILNVDPETIAESDPGNLPAPTPAQIQASVGNSTFPTSNNPISVYQIRAPIAGTIIDQEPLVPGIPVHATDQMFILANLSKVWVEVDIHESEFALLHGRNGAEVRIHSPAYPNQSFLGTVFYTGDIVNPQSRTIRLMATAPNPDRLLKPGMFVEVEVMGLEKAADTEVQVPATALVSHDERTFVFVQKGPELFERREVLAIVDPEGPVWIKQGVEPGEHVVTEGAFHLKAELLRLASGESAS